MALIVMVVMILCIVAMIVFVLDTIRMENHKPPVFHRHRWIPYWDMHLHEQCTVCKKIRVLPDPQESQGL